MDNWLAEQMVRNGHAFESAMLTEYPEARAYTADPERYFERVCEQCNYLAAAQLVDWKAVIAPGSRILDLAGGTGWLSAYLSTFENAAQITIVDASQAYLESNLPVSIRRLGGDAGKIRPVVGHFSPLLFADASLDLVVVSSSLHHADNLEAVLREIHRVLVPGGRCYILNEVPVGDIFYLRCLLTCFARIIGRTLTHGYTASSPSISSSGYLYDPLLGDRMFPRWYWRAAIARAGFTLQQVLDTQLTTVKGDSGLSLVHFLCNK